MIHFQSICPICEHAVPFESNDDFWSCRDGLYSRNCPLNSCVTRERAMASALFSVVSREALSKKVVYECSPCMRGLSLWLRQHVPGYTPTGFFPDQPFGETVHGLRNENLEQLTLPDGSVDIWIHLDVLEHLFKPFKAMQEIYRTLVPCGVCLFTAPTYPDRARSEQVAFLQPDGTTKIVGQPEYHGNRSIRNRARWSPGATAMTCPCCFSARQGSMSKSDAGNPRPSPSWGP